MQSIYTYTVTQQVPQSNGVIAVLGKQATLLHTLLIYKKGSGKCAFIVITAAEQLNSAWSFHSFYVNTFYMLIIVY